MIWFALRRGVRANLGNEKDSGSPSLLPDWWARPSDSTRPKFPTRPCSPSSPPPAVSLAAPAPSPQPSRTRQGDRPPNVVAGEICPPAAAMAAPHDEAAAWSEEAARRVWAGAVPLQVHLHDADVTALPPPPPFLVCVRMSPPSPTETRSLLSRQQLPTASFLSLAISAANSLCSQDRNSESCYSIADCLARLTVTLIKNHSCSVPRSLQ